ncbi:MAG: hypothetical protein IT539_05430 [Bradyrhizobiaceae bacterium]|nr:hypothetical protein [Bradyrhizobiaceae bacterium]
MSSPNTDRAVRWLAPVLFCAGVLAGCADADLYLDRRDTISLSAGDAVAANIVAQTVDPWPRVAGNRNIAFNGDRMQAAGERYRSGKVIPPKGISTSSVEFSTSNTSSGAAGQ